jgi:hypothetical protein
VGAYLLALGNAPSYANTFREALETEIVRFPATSNPALFREAVDIGGTLFTAWSLQCSPTGRWRQIAPQTALGRAKFEFEVIVFENGDRLEEVHPRITELSISGYPVMQRYLEARAHLILDFDLAEQIRRVAASLAAILDAQSACEQLLAQIIAGSTINF